MQPLGDNYYTLSEIITILLLNKFPYERTRD